MAFNKKVLITLFFAMFVFSFNMDDAYAGGSRAGGTGEGYAQCAYMWQGDTKISSNADLTITAKEAYRIIVKAYGTKNEQGSFLNWTEKMTKSAIGSQSSVGENIELSVDDDSNITNFSYHSIANKQPVDFMYKDSSYVCPSKICYREPISYDNNYSWYFPESGNCLSSYKVANIMDWGNWVDVSQTGTTTGTIVATDLSEKVTEGTATDTIGNSELDFSGGIEKTELSCQMLDEDGILKSLSDIFTAMQIGGIILLIVLTIWDFVKAIASSEDDRLKKNLNRFIFRLIAGAILLLLPIMINFVLELLQASGVDQIGDFCIDSFLQ